MSPLLEEGNELTLVGDGRTGITLVLASSPLTRLNYFDGKFLRAEHLRREQDYVRRLVRYANQGLGAGIVYGFSTELSGGGRLSIGAGLAVDGEGRTLLLPDTEEIEIASLLAARAKQVAMLKPASVSERGGAFRPCVDIIGPEGPTVRAGSLLYLICVAHVESLCGEEDVFGRLCEQACVSAAERPWIVEGVLLRAVPLRLEVPMAMSRSVALDRRHLRSLVASAYYAQEWRDGGSLISGDGLRRPDTWCLGALGPTGACVPLGVLGLRGSETLFFDAWTARRERMETPARAYWAGIMRMRSWSAYLAQILQFQCQLHDVLGGGGAPGQPADPCSDHGSVLLEAEQVLTRLGETFAGRMRNLADRGAEVAGAAFPQVNALRNKLSAAIATLAQVPSDRVLISNGIVELPPAGYLPVVPGTIPVETQVRRYMGEGVDLRFCVVREDFVAHALEEAQHMERISLLTGLDEPARKPAVDILVPEGELDAAPAPALTGYEATLVMSQGGERANEGLPTAHGLARGETRAGGAKGFYLAAVKEAKTIEAAAAATATAEAFASMPEAGELGVSERAAARMRERMAEAAEVRFDSSVAARMAGHAVEMHIRRSADAAAAAGAQPAPAAAPTVGVVAQPKIADIALWMEVRVDGDIFAARAGDTLNAAIEQGTYAVTQEVKAASIGLQQAKVFIEEAGPLAGGGRRVVCRVTGTQSQRSAKDDVAEAEDAPSAIDYRATLTRSGNDADGSVTILVGPPAIPPAVDPRAVGGFEITTTWANNSASVRMQASMVTRKVTDNGEVTERRKELILLTLKLNQPAFVEGSPLRSASTAGLQLIEDSFVRANLASAQYADAALAKLFPRAPVTKPVLRATRDWVLFHRRRIKDCADMPATPVPEPAIRKYALIVINGFNADTAKQIGRTLAEDIDRYPQVISSRMPAIFIGLLEFREGASALETPVTQVRTQWKDKLPTDVAIAFLGASDAAGEDDAVIRGRIASTQTALAPIVVADPLTLTKVIPKVPSGVNLQGGEELMLAVVYKAARAQGRIVRVVVTRGFDAGTRSARPNLAGAEQLLFWLTTNQEGVPSPGINTQAGFLVPLLREFVNAGAAISSVSLVPVGVETPDATRARADSLLAALKEADPQLFALVGFFGSIPLQGTETDLARATGTMPTASDVLFIHTVELN